MSPRAAKDPKNPKDPCVCDAHFIFTGAIDGQARASNCRCNNKVPRAGVVCGMCERGIHGTGIVWKVAVDMKQRA